MEDLVLGGTVFKLLLKKWDRVEIINLVEDVNLWRGVLNAGMNIRASQNAGKYLLLATELVLIHGALCTLLKNIPIMFK